MGASLGEFKEPVKPFELIRGLGKGRSRMRGDLGGWGGARETGAEEEVEAEEEIEEEAEVEGCGMRTGGKGVEARGCEKGERG